MQKRRKRIVVVRSPGQLGYHWKAVVQGDCIKWIEDRHISGSSTSPENLAELEVAIKNGETEYREEYFRWEIEEVKRFGSLRFLMDIFSVFDPLGNVLGRIAALLVVLCIGVGLFLSQSHFTLPLWLTIIAIPFLLLICLFLAWISYNIVGERFSKNDPLSRTMRCPKCGSKTKYVSRSVFTDSSAGPGRIVRTASESSLKVCQKCGFEEAL